MQPVKIQNINKPYCVIYNPAVFAFANQEPPPPSSRHLPTMASALDLPDELLILIFEFVAASIATSAVYNNLSSLQLTCTQWEGVARMLLYSRVEIAKRADATALERTVGPGVPDNSIFLGIDTLVVGIAERQEGIMNQAQFRRLLRRLPGIRRIVIFHDGFSNDTFAEEGIRAWNDITPSLIDLTIISSSALEGSLTAFNLVRNIPCQIRFLNLLCKSIFIPDSAWFSTGPPPFELYGLTTEEYPSAMTNWVLSSSGPTLRLLTVVEVSNLPLLSTNHPHLRSLRILDPVRAGSLTQSFMTFQSLERLELRNKYAPVSVVATLPSSLKYIRVWSPKSPKACWS